MTITENERNKMDTISNAVTAIASKPITGLSIGASATILAWIGFLTPILAFITLVIGVGAATYSFIHNRNQVKLDALQFRHYEKLNQK